VKLVIARTIPTLLPRHDSLASLLRTTHTPPHRSHRPSHRNHRHDSHPPSHFKLLHLLLNIIDGPRPAPSTPGTAFSRLRRYNPCDDDPHTLPDGRLSHGAADSTSTFLSLFLPLPSPTTEPPPSHRLCSPRLPSHRLITDASQELAGLSGGPVMASTTTPSDSQDTALPRDPPRGRRVA
jgi:hypothetical protein